MTQDRNHSIITQTASWSVRQGDAPDDAAMRVFPSRNRPRMVLFLEPLPWESRVLREPRWRVTGLFAKTDRDLKRGTAWLRRTLRKFRAASVWMVVDIGKSAVQRALEQAGFINVDGSVTLECRVPGPVRVPRQVPVRTAGPRDGREILRTATGAFTHGRFFHEPDLGPVRAGQLYRAWAKNTARGDRADRLFVAGKSGADGFLSLRKEGGSRRVWIDLLAVRPDRQAQGAGTALVNAAKRQARAWARDLGVRTPVENFQACLFYMKNGFRPASFSLNYIFRGKAR